MLLLNSFYLDLLKSEDGYFRKETLKWFSIKKEKDWQIKFLSTPRDKEYVIRLLTSSGKFVPSNATEDWIVQNYGGTITNSQERLFNLKINTQGLEKGSLLKLTDEIYAKMQRESFIKYPVDMCVSSRGLMFDKNKQVRTAYLYGVRACVDCLKKELGL